MVEVKLIRDDKKEFLIDGTIWGIPSNGLEGFDGVDFSSEDESLANADGGYNVGSRVDIKDRTVTAILKNSALNETMRKYVVSFFNPKHTFKLFIKYMGVERWCEGTRVGFSCPNANIYRPLKLKFTIRSLMPYLMSVENFGKNIAGDLPLAGFPFLSNVATGFGTGAYKFAKNIEIDNDGDVESFIRCVMVAKGTVQNPKLIKDDKFVRIVDTMQKNDVYEIDFMKTPPTVRKNGENAIGNVDRRSSFSKMALEVGKSSISYDAETGSNNLDVNFYFYKRYGGI